MVEVVILSAKALIGKGAGAVTAGRRGACCAKRVGQRAAQSGRKNGKPGFWPEVRFQGGALVRAADKGSQLVEVVVLSPRALIGKGAA